MNWSTPADLRQQLQRLWEQGVLLRVLLEDTSPFPLQLRLKKPSSVELATRFDDVRQWIGQLQAGEGDYRLEWKGINHRQLGRNRVPDLAWIDSLDAALRSIGKQRERHGFEALSANTLAVFPELRDWLSRQPLRALQHAGDWPRVLAVLHWFRSNPASGLYLRQLDIPGVDTKFIEQRRGLLGELLDIVLGNAVHAPDARGARAFERRYGLREKPIRIRLRILDPALAIAGLDDLELPLEHLAALPLAAERVFITENETNFLAFPAQPGSLILFGQGYALDRLAGIPWLHQRPLHYWGDIDTHGFAILDRLRAHLPHARSLLMDRPTLLQHHPLWGEEPANKRCTSDLQRLDEAERALYHDLRDDRLRPPDGRPALRVRLEQEHVRFGWLDAALANLRTEATPDDGG
jgi:hypothetical protein